MNLSNNIIDLISVLCGLTFVGYYGYLIGEMFNPTPGMPKMTKKRFLYGLIPLSIWILIVIEQYSELE